MKIDEMRKRIEVGGWKGWWVTAGGRYGEALVVSKRLGGNANDVLATLRGAPEEIAYVIAAIEGGIP